MSPGRRGWMNLTGMTWPTRASCEGDTMTPNCQTCGQPMTMYYRWVCLRCNKPKPEKVPVLNLLEVMHHIEQTVEPGFFDRAWDALCDMHGFGNNRYFQPSKDKDNPVLARLKEAYPNIKNPIYWISW